MLHKIRLHGAGTLRADYHANLGSGFDGRCCRFLGIQYAALRDRVLEGGTDDEILAWCFTHRTRPNDEQVLKFMLKRGWRDEDVQCGTDARSRRCLKPPGWAPWSWINHVAVKPLVMEVRRLARNETTRLFNRSREEMVIIRHIAEPRSAWPCPWKNRHAGQSPLSGA
jgi:Domain of unknown function (DUF5069)